MAVRVFVCHHENDTPSCDALSRQLRFSERSQEIALWSRRRVLAGEDVGRAVREELEQADLVLVLLSADLIACDYCWGVEVSAALQRHRAGRVRLVPVIVRACDWRACFPGIQPVPTDGAPLVTDTAKIDDGRFCAAASEILRVARAIAEEESRHATLVTPMTDILAELRRLEQTSTVSAADATNGLLRLSAGLRFLDPAAGAGFFASDDAMSRAVPESALTPLRRASTYPSSLPPGAAPGLATQPPRRPAAPWTGDRVRPGLELVSRLGAGGMASVWQALNLALGTPVAVKLMNVDHLESPELRERFRQEARILARIQSPHVVQVLDYGETDQGIPYIVMELIDGQTLEERLKRFGPLPLSSVVQIVLQIASALGEAHRFGIVHRDLKPDNVFLLQVDGEIFVKVIDFGVAKLPAADQKMALTAPGQMVGTPSYMSPEAMVDSRAVDHRADLWSLAAIAYEALTLRRPFPRKSFVEVILATHAGVFEKPTALRPDLPEAVDAWMERALKPDPAVRFGSLREAAEAFRAAALPAGTSEGATPEAVAPVLPPAVAEVLHAPATPPTGAESPAAQGTGTASGVHVPGAGVAADMRAPRAGGPRPVEAPRAAPTLVSGGQTAPGTLDLVHREGRREGHAEGRIQGAALALLTVLTTRGISVDDASREHILHERDPERLALWLRRAVHAASVTEVLADG